MWLYLLLIVVALLVIKVVNISLYWSRRGIPYEPLPRALYRLIWLYNTKSIYDVVCDDVQRYGKLYGSFRGFTPSLVTSDLEIAKDVLIKQFGSFFKRTFEVHTGDPLWDNTVTHLPYDQWKAVRTVMSYSFTPSKMRGMIPKMNKIAMRYSDKLAATSQSTEKKFQLKPFMYGYSLDAVVAVSFGIDVNALENPDSDFARLGSKLFQSSVALLCVFFLPAAFKYIPFVNFPPKDMSKYFTELGKRVLKEKRENLDEVIKNGTADILDLHLIAQREDPKNHITDEVLASQAFLFFTGGTDTMSITVQLTCYFLAMNPEAQDRAYEEIISVLGDRTDVQYEDLQKMKYVEAAICEAVRVFPLTFSLDRIATENTEVAGIQIDKGTIVEFPVPSMQNDPELFPEPEKFLPERFLKDGTSSCELGAFLTFGDGPKGCIGRRLALMVIQVLLVRILLEVKLEPCEETPIPLKMKPGFNFSQFFDKAIVLGVAPRQ